MKELIRTYYQSDISPNIVGGQETSNPDFINHAYKVLENGAIDCTGFEFPYNSGRLVVATAAHCIDDMGSLVSVKGPGKTLQEGENVAAMPVRLKQIDPAQPAPDIALLITNKQASDKLPYSLSTQDLQINNSITIVGFGDESLHSPLSEKLKQAQQAVWTIGPTIDEKCGKIELKEFCSIPVDGNSCNGDSGGGVFRIENNILQLVGLITQSPGGECAIGTAGEEWNKWKSQAYLCATNPAAYPAYCEIPVDCISAAIAQQTSAVSIDTTDARPELYLPSMSTEQDAIFCVNTSAITGVPEDLPAATQSATPLLALAILGSVIGREVKKRLQN